MVYAIGVPLLAWEVWNLAKHWGDSKEREARPARSTRGHIPRGFILALIVCLGLWLVASDLERASASFHDDGSATATGAACIIPKVFDGGMPGQGPDRPRGLCEEGRRPLG